MAIAVEKKGVDIKDTVAIVKKTMINLYNINNAKTVPRTPWASRAQNHIENLHKPGNCNSDIGFEI